LIEVFNCYYSPQEGNQPFQQDQWQSWQFDSGRAQHRQPTNTDTLIGIHFQSCQVKSCCCAINSWSFVISKEVVFELSKTRTGNSNSTTKEATRTIASKNGTRTSMTHENNSFINQKTTAAIEVEQPLLLPNCVSYTNIDAPKLNLKAFNQTDSGKDRLYLLPESINHDPQILLSMQY
jgi:hypothetical protein